MKSSKWSKEDRIQLQQEAPAPAQRITEKDRGVSERMSLISLSERDALNQDYFFTLDKPPLENCKRIQVHLKNNK